MSSPPVKYVKSFDYALDPTLNVDFDRLKSTTDQTIDRLAEIQRDDGALENQIVTLESLSDDTLAMIGGNGDPRGPWQANTDYYARDLVVYLGATFIASIDHLSGLDFTVDFAAGKWMVFAQSKPLIAGMEVFSSTAAMLAGVSATLNDGQPYVTAGRTVAGDGGGGVFYLVMADTSTADNGGDCIEINTLADWKHTTISGNLLDASLGTAPQAGFAIGAANAQRLTITHNKIIGSANEAIHIEDGSQDVDIGANIIYGMASGTSAINILVNTVRPVQRIHVHDNICMAQFANTGIGIQYAYTGQGWAKNVITSGNHVEGFSVGIYHPGNFQCHDNFIKSVGTGIVCLGLACPTIHDNRFEAVTTTLYGATDGGIVGMTTYHGPGVPPALAQSNSGNITINGLLLVGVWAHPGGSATVAICPAPAGYIGVADARGSLGDPLHRTENAAMVRIAAGALTQLVAATAVTRDSGSLAAAALSVSGANLMFGAFIAGPNTVNYSVMLNGPVMV